MIRSTEYSSSSPSFRTIFCFSLGNKLQSAQHRSAIIIGTHLRIQLPRMHLSCGATSIVPRGLPIIFHERFHRYSVKVTYAPSSMHVVAVGTEPGVFRNVLVVFEPSTCPVAPDLVSMVSSRKSRHDLPAFALRKWGKSEPSGKVYCRQSTLHTISPAGSRLSAWKSAASSKDSPSCL